MPNLINQLSLPNGPITDQKYYKMIVCFILHMLLSLLFGLQRMVRSSVQLRLICLLNPLVMMIYFLPFSLLDLVKAPTLMALQLNSIKLIRNLLGIQCLRPFSNSIVLPSWLQQYNRNFRLVSLCSVNYKIFTKLFAN